MDSTSINPMTTPIKTEAGGLWTDFHSHCLPGMDDGAGNLETAAAMLRLLGEQGVSRVALTSHYYPHREPLPRFLERREEAFRQLEQAPGRDSLPQTCLGAEVRLVRGIGEQDLWPLCIQGTRLLLLELPMAGYRPWMLEELQNLTYSLDIVPLLAHIERYLAWYTKADYEALLSFDELVFQCNMPSLMERKSFRFLYGLMEAGYPLVPGSDAHNLDSRPPRFGEASAALERSRKGRALLAHLRESTRALQG